MIYDEKLWHNAKMIYTNYRSYYRSKESPWGKKSEVLANEQSKNLHKWFGLPIFVKNFKIKNPTSAKMFFTALGCCDIWINGKKIGNDEMKPGFINFNKRTLYYEYDITDAVYDGDNRILAVVSPGWYLGRISGGYFGSNNPAFMACIITNDENGENITVSDSSWGATVGGQIRTADIWDGEYCDGRKDNFSQMSQPEYDECLFKKAKICDYFNGEVSPFVGPTVQVRDNLSLKAKTTTVYDGVKENETDYGEINIVSQTDNFPILLKKGQKAIIDLGQEMVGWAKITVNGKRGTTVTMRYSEFLNDSGMKSRGNDGPKGSAYIVNMRSAKAKAHYVLSGKGEEIYRPTFTFFGYRYVEISANKDFELVDFISEVVGSATNETGHIETSDANVNKLISNIIWGQRSNYLSVPTDCPQRDERLGWTGDAQAFSRTASYNADVLGFFHKWMQDMRDSQSDEGAFPDVAPRVKCCTSENAAAWSDAGVIIPYNMYVMYGDKSIIEENFDAMDKYIKQIIDVNGMKGPEPRYGDWLAYDYCKNEFIASAYLVHDIDLMIQMSNAIERFDVAQEYKELRVQAYEYFCSEFMKDGKLIGETQADYAISLLFDLVEGDYAVEVAAKLAEKIEENGYRLSTGFVGTYCLCLALSKFGEDNIAYDLLLQRNEPSWLYSVDQGATTIWERWNSYTLENGFGDVGMNSFNHYAYGSVEEWMYRYMAGIETDGAGFKNILLQPRIDTRTDAKLPQGQKRITWVKASYNSVAGLIESAWNTENGFTYECTVPEGSTATLKLPVFSDGIKVNGAYYKVADLERDGKYMIIRLEDGKFCIEEC